MDLAVKLTGLQAAVISGLSFNSSNACVRASYADIWKGLFPNGQMTTSVAGSVSAAKLGQGTQSPGKRLKHHSETGNHAVEGTLEFSLQVYQMCYYKHVIGGF